MSSVSLVIALSFFVAIPVFATDEVTSVTTTPTSSQDAVNSTTAAETTSDASTVDTTSIADDEKTEVESVSIKITEVEDLDGVEVDKIEKIPSNFGLWWRSVRETLSLALTWNDLDKAEKALKFAEERMRIAKLIAEQAPDDTKAQIKAEKMIAKAQRFLDKVEAKKDKWSKDKDAEEVDTLVKNIATHQSNSDVIMDKLETELPAESADILSGLREERSEASKRLLNAIANENISAETKEHLEEVKDRIEDHAEEVAEYNAQRKALQEKVQSGDATAREDLAELKEERQTQIQVRNDSVEEIKTELQQQAATGSAAAQKKLDIINRIQSEQKNGQTEDVSVNSATETSEIADKAIKASEERVAGNKR